MSGPGAEAPPSASGAPPSQDPPTRCHPLPGWPCGSCAFHLIRTKMVLSQEQVPGVFQGFVLQGVGTQLPEQDLVPPPRPPGLIGAPCPHRAGCS